jgi:hypothetical protein
VNEEKIPAIYFSRRLRVHDDVQQLNGRDIRFVNNVMYLGVAFFRRMTRRYHIEGTVAKALSTYVRTYTLFKSGLLSTNIKFRLYKALITSGLTWAYAADDGSLETAASDEQITPRYWKI